MSQSQSDSEFIGGDRAIVDSCRLLDAFRRPRLSETERRLLQSIELARLSLRLGLPQTAERALNGEFTS